MTQEQFLSGFLPLSEAFEKEYSPAVTDLYFNALKRFEYADFQRACAEILATKKFMPKIAEFLEILDPKPTKEEIGARAIAAWNAATLARMTEGQYRSVKFDDVKIHRVIQTYGGWIKFCLFDDSKYGEAAERNSFIRIYCDLKDEKGDYPHLMGLTERDGYFDYEVEKVSFIQTRNLPVGEPCKIERRSIGKVLQIEAQRREALAAKTPIFGMIEKITFAGGRK